MALPSKRRPWAVEIKPPASNTWYHMDAYRDQATAEANAKLARERNPDPQLAAEIRVREHKE